MHNVHFVLSTPNSKEEEKAKKGEEEKSKMGFEMGL
jgi:hypothetical protein